MTIFQFILLAASAFFAYKIYEHVQSLKDEESAEHEPTREAFSPFDPEALVEKADEAYEREEYERAVALLVEADVKDPQNPDILFKLGYISNLLEQSEQALEYYKSALEVDGENEYIHNAIASIYRANGEYASAKLHLQASLNLNDTNATTYYNFGNLYQDMGHITEAKSMYEKALELNPELDAAKEELEKLS